MESLSAAGAGKKRLAVFLDGTWNSVSDNTNVWRLRALCSTKDTGNPAQLAYYDIGVNGVIGGAFGKGLLRNILDAYEWLVENYNDGDDIFVFGFSRGAFTARSLTGFITKCGLLRPGAPLSVNQLFARYRRRDALTVWKLHDDLVAGPLKASALEERWMLKYSRRVPIKLVAVWDTVGALGIPAFSWEGISRTSFRFLDTGLRVPIENAFHALALDEHRNSFMPTLWTKRIPTDPQAVIAPPRPYSSVEQRWFAGAHGNVGGGYPNDLLAQAPLSWIIEKARSHGLAFRSDIEVDDGALDAPISDSYREFMRGSYAILSKRHLRPIASPPGRDPDATYINVNETIDGSVFERYRHSSSYRPANLVEWSTRKGVDLDAVMGWVDAEQPGKAVGEIH